MPLESASPVQPLSSVGHVPASGPEPYADPTQPPAALSAPPSMENLLAVFRQRWLAMLFFGGIAAAAAVAVAWFLTPGKYTASAVIQFPKIKGVNEGETEQINFQRASAALFKSSVLQDKVVAEPEIAGLNETRQHADPAVWLAKDLTTDSNQLGADMLRVNLSGDFPEDVAVILNQLLQLYNKEFEAREGGRTQLRRDQLKEKYKSVSSELRRLRLTLQDREKGAGVEDLATLSMKQSAVMSQLTGLETQRAQLRQQMIKARLDLNNFEAQSRSPSSIQVSHYAVEREMRLDSIVGKRLEEMLELEKKIVDFVRIAGVNSPDAKRLRDQQESLRQGVEEYRKRIEKGLRDKEAEDLKDSIAKSKSAIELIEKQEKDLDDQILNKNNDLLKLRVNPAAVAQGVTELRDEVERTVLMQKRIAEEMGTLEAEAALAARVTIIDNAQVPTARRVDRKIKMAGMAGLGLFGIVALGVALMEFGKRRVYGSEDVSRGLGIKLLGSLPTLSARARKASPIETNGVSPRADQVAMLEAVDALRTVLLYAARNQHFRTVMVTSPNVGEGKTSLASQLATSLARSGRKTLLLDLDLRNPSAHIAFDMPLAPGFSEVLRGEGPLDTVIYPTALEGLSVLPAGQADRLAIQMLGREDLSEMMKYLQDHFDFIVIDTSPVLPVADTIQIGQYVDAVLLSVLRGVSRLPAIYAAQQRLAGLGIHILGAVLTGDSANTYGMVRNGQLGK